MQLNIKIILLILLAVTGKAGNAQTIQVLHDSTKVSLRGLSVVTDRIVWVSGSHGTVGRSLDSGRTWKWLVVKGMEKTEFRDIEAFDETSAVIMAVGEPAYILRTADGGDSWKIVYENRTPGMFLDAMEFWNEMSGIVVGDPINNKIFIARTFDGGIHWREIPSANYPDAAPGEAMFASSGTNVRKLNQQEAVIVTGGKRSRLLIRDQQIDLPILQGTESTGANSIAVKGSKQLVVVGGDYQQKDATEKNCCISYDGGQSFTVPDIAPHGYRSCVEYIRKKEWITCGLNGVDRSTDDGRNWTLISSIGFHVCRKAKDGKSVFLAGNNGRVGKLIR